MFYGMMTSNIDIPFVHTVHVEMYSYENSKFMFAYAGVQRAYEQWACSQKMAVFGEAGAEATPPCLDMCQQVEERCPHLVPDPDDGSGEPAFLCGASHPFGELRADAILWTCLI